MKKVSLWRTVVLLALPLAFFGMFYVLPMISVVNFSVDNSAIYDRLPRLAEWSSNSGVVDDDAARRLLDDLAAIKSYERAEVARLLNQEKSGFRSLLISTGAEGDRIDRSLDALVSFDDRWQDQGYWDAIRKSVTPVTGRFFQKATGYKPDADGNFNVSPGDDIYLQILLRTILISLQVTLLTLIIGYPLAYAIATGGSWTRTLVWNAVILSFWISILVRTTAWVVLLQNNGVINSILINFGLTEAPIQLIFTRFSTVLAITHVLLPFAILPMINVMRQIPVSQVAASRSLGAGPARSFIKVYFPQTLRGVAIGAGSVYMLSLGFYITPALVGGPSDQMLSFHIADFMQRQLNWGMASALSILLMGCVIALLILAFCLRGFLAPKEQRA